MSAQEFSRFNTGRLDLAYKEWPGESPPVLFLHGLTTGMAFWSSRIDLRGRQRALAYDARGHGESDRAPCYRWTDFGEDAVSFVEGVCGEHDPRGTFTRWNDGDLCCCEEAGPCHRAVPC
jgi:pimeloyl-ACP methyl ester carboxylesterase